MRTLTATEASRGFAAMLDRVEHGETVLITRDGRPVARVEPERVTSGARVLALFAAHAADPGFADDLESARRYARALPSRIDETNEDEANE